MDKKNDNPASSSTNSNEKIEIALQKINSRIDGLEADFRWKEEQDIVMSQEMHRNFNEKLEVFRANTLTSINSSPNVSSAKTKNGKQTIEKINNVNSRVSDLEKQVSQNTELLQHLSTKLDSVLSLVQEQAVERNTLPNPKDEIQKEKRLQKLEKRIQNLEYCFRKDAAASVTILNKLLEVQEKSGTERREEKKATEDE
eukprot:g2547.t1